MQHKISGDLHVQGKIGLDIRDQQENNLTER